MFSGGGPSSETSGRVLSLWRPCVFEVRDLSMNGTGLQLGDNKRAARALASCDTW